MSGHSHFKKIKHQKNINDKKRSQLFSKMTKAISITIKEGGSNPETNIKLKTVIEKAKNYNLPKENIERAIKQATGKTENANLQEIIFEAVGPKGMVIIIEGITDNKNRALGEIRQVLNRYKWKLASEGAVRWMFEKRGRLTLSIKIDKLETKNKEEIELMVIEAGAEDVDWHNDSLGVYVKPEELGEMKRKLEEKRLKIETTSLDWVTKEKITLNEKDKDSCQTLFNALDELDSVQEVYSNLNIIDAKRI